MKALVTGVNGQLGHDVMLALEAAGYEAVGSGSAETYHGVPDLAAFPYVQMNITEKQQVMEVVSSLRPDAVIHCAAWTAVDAAEETENREKVDLINHLGTRYIAEAVEAIDAKMLYLSTDYVFDGKGEHPWQPDDTCFAPLNVYGQSKLDGEQAVASVLKKFFIVRIAWVFGLNGNNFIKTMLKAGKTHDAVNVVNDQIGTPTYTKDLAGLLVDMIGTEEYGYYHATNDEDGDYISWYDFCCEIYRQAGLTTKVIPVTTAEYGVSRAARPFNSRLDKKKLAKNGFDLLPHWKDAVHRYLAEIGEI